jgi:hypothetical protein
MADEIKANISIVYNTAAAAGLQRTIQPGTINITQTNIGLYGKVQTIGTGSTTVEVIGYKSTNEGLLYMRNLDTTNFVTYGSSLLEFKMKAGEPAFVRVKPGATVQIKADTASVKVDTEMFED